MKADLLSTSGTWRNVADRANDTIGKEAGTKEPSSKWKRRILLCEHSPIRGLWWTIKLSDLKYWVSVHLVRHKHGIEHLVRTQRTDRTVVSRDDLPQDTLVNHTIGANAQAMINISRRRLCSQASCETRQAWQAVLESIKDSQPELYSVCVPDCIYRGYCFEFTKCGYANTEEFQQRLKQYREGA